MRRVWCIWLLALSFVAMAMTPEARRSFAAFEQKAENGDAEAQYRLALLLEKGYDSIPADSARSLSLLRRSAHAGHAPALNYLGFLFRQGTPLLSADLDSTYHYLRLAATAGDAKAASNLAYLMLSPENLLARDASETTVALGYLQQAVDARLPHAMTIMADLLAEGEIVPKDSLKAIELYESAVSDGFRDAELKLLNLIGPSLSRLSPAETLRQALRYKRLGAPIIAVEMLQNIGPAEPETAHAYALLGDSYSRGVGAPYDHRRANEYFARAALLGDPAASFIIAETLEIFPDALSDILPEHITPQLLRDVAASAGITTAEQAIHSLWNP